MFKNEGLEYANLCEENMNSYWTKWNEEGLLNPEKGFVVDMQKSKRGWKTLSIICGVSLSLIAITIGLKLNVIFPFIFGFIFCLSLYVLLKDIYYSTATLCVTKNSFVFDCHGKHKEIDFNEVSCFKEKKGNVYDRYVIYSNNKGRVWFTHNVEAASYLLPFLKSSFPNK